MLKSLYIKNFALIDEVIISLDSGLTVITGETGAGKSIILGALSLILGQRAENRFIKEGEEKCVIEGIFNIPKYSLQSLFEKYDWNFDPQECIIRREIWANGKSRAFVNDSPVYVNDLKTLGEKLIDIHSQHESLSIKDSSLQLDIIDSIAKSSNIKSDYIIHYNTYRKIEEELRDIKNQSQKNQEELDYIKYQYSIFNEAKLNIGEQEILEEELESIVHAEEIKSNLYELIHLLSNDEHGVESNLKKTLVNVKAIEKYISKTELSNRIESAYIDLKDLREDAERIFEDTQFNPDRQRIIEERLGTIYSLQKRYSVNSTSDLLDIYSKLEEKLNDIDLMDERIEKLQKQYSIQKNLVLEKAKTLSHQRKSSLNFIEKKIIDLLNYLGIVNARFKIEIKDKVKLDNSGMDTVVFLFSANKNNQLKPIQQIASGGEISRLMLSLKSIIANAIALPTIIFDEVDTGTSGEIADKIGHVMQNMSENIQVIAITHLPQIAAKGNAHFYVYKDHNHEETTTLVKKLNEEERVNEIASMLSGARTTIQALENARVMLNKSN